MNVPLTIEQLKALPIGEWVWITMETEDSYIVGYYQLIHPLYTRLNAVGAVDLDLSYSDYGKTWTAYRNREQAEGAIDYETEYNALHASVIDHCYKMDEKDYRKHFYDMTIGNRIQLIEQSQAEGKYDSRVEQAKKQTAKAIINELLSAREFEPLYDLDESGYVRLKYVKEIAKKYGVEVDE